MPVRTPKESTDDRQECLFYLRNYVTMIPELQIISPDLSTATVEDFLTAETTSAGVVARIHELKEKLRDKVVILGHHYQRDDIIQFADKTGDSFELARYA